MSYKNSNELNQIINTKLPGQPQFKHWEVVQSGEVLEFYAHDIIECLHALWGDLDFEGDLILEPKQLYTDKDMTIWIYHEMNTGKWWHTQVIISLILFCSSCSQNVFRRRSRLQCETKTSRSYQLSFHPIKLSSHNSMES